MSRVFPLCLYFSSSFLFSLGCCRFYKDFFPALYTNTRDQIYNTYTHIYMPIPTSSHCNDKL